MHWPGEMAGLRHVDEPRGAGPGVCHPRETAPLGVWQALHARLLATDGDGTVAVESWTSS
jgi:hypothetical protein